MVDGFQIPEFEGYVGSPGENKLTDKILELREDNPSSARIVLRGFWERNGA